MRILHTHRWNLTVPALTMMTLCLVTHTTLQADTRGQAHSDAARGLVSSMRELVDLPDDGEPEQLRHYEESTYDTHGNRVLFVEHNWQNDQWRVETTTSTYDSESNLIHEIWDRGSQVVKRWLDYDSRGNLTEEHIEIHNRSELTYVDLKTYRYDQQGNLVEETYLRDGPERDDLQRWTFAYNERGDVVEEVTERDNGMDGPDSWVRSTYTYNERGDLVEEVTERDYGYDGTIFVYRTFFSYDTTGKLQERRIQSFDADSQLTTDQSWSYAYDPTGSQMDVHVVTRSFLAAGPPVVILEAWSRYQYDPRGNLVELRTDEKQDEDCNQFIFTYQLDPQGRPLETKSILTLGSCDGQVRTTSGTVTSSAYDQWGNLVQVTSRYERDGNPGTISTRIYEY